MKFCQYSLNSLILIITCLYLLYRNLPFCPGDPFLLFLGLVIIALFTYDRNNRLLTSGIILTGIGLGQIIVENNLLPFINPDLLYIGLLGLSLLFIFIITHYLDFNNETIFPYAYWPLFIGSILILFSIIFIQNLESTIWNYIKTYWPIMLPVLSFPDFMKKNHKVNGNN